MPRHPLPPRRKRCALILWAVFAVAILQGALWKAAERRRELIEQEQRAHAWRVPEVGENTFNFQLSLSPDEHQLICTLPSGKARIFDAHTGYVISNGATPPPYISAVLSDDDGEVASQTNNGTRVSLIDSVQGQTRRLRVERNEVSTTLTKLPADLFDSVGPEMLQLSADGLRFAVLKPDALWWYDVRSQGLLRVVRPKTKNGHWAAESEGDCESSVLSRDGKYILSIAPRPTLYNARTGQKIRSFGTALHTRYGGCGDSEPETGFSPDDKVMWVYDAEKSTVAFWRTNGGSKVLQLDADSWQFDSTGQYIISDATDTLYKATSGKVVRKLTWCESRVLVVAPHNHQLYILRPDGRIYRYHLP